MGYWVTCCCKLFYSGASKPGKLGSAVKPGGSRECSDCSECVLTVEDLAVPEETEAKILTEGEEARSSRQSGGQSGGVSLRTFLPPSERPEAPLVAHYQASVPVSQVQTGRETRSQIGMWLQINSRKDTALGGYPRGISCHFTVSLWHLRGASLTFLISELKRTSLVSGVGQRVQDLKLREDCLPTQLQIISSLSNKSPPCPLICNVS